MRESPIEKSVSLPYIHYIYVHLKINLSLNNKSEPDRFRSLKMQRNSVRELEKLQHTRSLNSKSTVDLLFTFFIYNGFV